MIITLWYGMEINTRYVISIELNESRGQTAGDRQFKLTMLGGEKYWISEKARDAIVHADKKERDDK